MPIIARFALSLDGFSAAGARWPEVSGSAGAVAMGRTAFDAAIAEPGPPWPDLDVHVLTSRPLPAVGPGSAATAHADPAAMVEALRAYRRDVHVLGGPRTIQTLIDLGAVDRLDLLLVPVLVGEGTPLAVDESLARDLRLDDTTPYPDGAVGLSYEFV